MVLSMIAIVIFKPSAKLGCFNLPLYWIPPFLGVCALLICSAVDCSDIIAGLTANSAVNPLKILTLFLCMTGLSVFLDELGFFQFLAVKGAKNAGSQKLIFFRLYALISLLTIFTSNDIIILTFTPFICFFCKKTNINPIPYLIMEFVAANTWSMLLIVGNPTNIYLATACGITFLDYAATMWLPTIFGGAVSLAVMYLLFRKELCREITAYSEPAVIKNKTLVIFGLVCLGACTICLAISSYVPIVEMWLIALVFMAALLIMTTIYCIVKHGNYLIIARTVKRMPFSLIPFVLSMFAFSVILKVNGVTAKLAELLGTSLAAWKYGTLSLISSNLINNIPMSVFFAEVIGNLSGESFSVAAFAAIIGSNIGAFLTPVGALAGIMWNNVLRYNKVHFTPLSFIKYGTVIAIPTMAAAISALTLLF